MIKTWHERCEVYEGIVTHRMVMDKMLEEIDELRQALAQPEKETFTLDRGCWERGCVAYDERDGDGVNISAERVDKTAKREQEPWPSVQCVCGGTIYFKYTPPISDYHEGWEEGFKAAKGEHEPFIYVREDNERPFGGFEHCSEADVGAFPVYTAPMLYTPQPKREWVGLTEDEREHFRKLGFVGVLAVEAKLKEKNSG